uniref:TFIIS N-terminal domain-containing protein n=1 Tax=Romanomermis culicivorax TaxID=13658 RepID=A0A915KI58_ROMCU
MHWRAAGINYIRYSQLAAQAVRSSLKAHLKVEAVKREGSTLRFTRWKEVVETAFSSFRIVEKIGVNYGKHTKMSTDELNIIKYKREMEQMIVKNILNLKRLSEILSHLNSVNVDLACLQRTKIGVCVNNVRKTFKNNAQIFQSTADLIKKWKKVAKEQFDHRKNSSSAENDQEEDHFNETEDQRAKDEDVQESTSAKNDDSSNSGSASETSSSILGSRNDSFDRSIDKSRKRKSENSDVLHDKESYAKREKKCKS